MRGLYISYDGALESLGQSQIIPYLKGLSGARINFVLITFEKKFFADKQKSARLYAELKAANIRWLRLHYHKNPPILSTAVDVIAGLFWSFRIIRKERIKLVHARGYVPAIIALVLKKIFGVKFIFDMRGFWPDIKAECGHWKREGILYKFVKFFEKMFLKNSDEVIVLTQRAKTIICEQGLTYCTITVVPCCVDTERFIPNIISGGELEVKINLRDKFVLAHTGSLEPWYMKKEMLDYFIVAKKILPNAHLLILSHCLKGKILELASKRGIKSDDITIAEVDFKQMPEYLSLVDAGIIFLSLEFSKSGCLPTKFAEFLSCGIPVICSSDIGDMDKIIIHNKVGVVINSFNEDEYRRSFLELLEIIKSHNLKERCRKVAEENFSLTKGLDIYRSIYARLEI